MLCDIQQVWTAHSEVLFSVVKGHLTKQNATEAEHKTQKSLFPLEMFTTIINLIR